MVRVFVNHVDCYTGNALSKIVSESVVGATLEDAQFDEDVDSQPPNQAQEATAIPKFEVVGTLKDPAADKPEWVAEVVQNSSPEELLAGLVSCDAIVYSITETAQQVDEASWAVQALHDQLSTFSSQKVFICISTVLTWARSKPLDPEEPDVPFTEEDYRRRRTHPNFKNHITAEKLVTKLGKTDKSKFVTYVVAPGLMYGAGEDTFHFLFKAAWHGDTPALKVFGDGENVVPTVHVHDLASIVVNVIDGRPKTRYILAVDDSKNTLNEIVEAISSGLSTGKLEHISKEDALLVKELSQSNYDHLLVNLQMEATCAKESMRITWKAETGLVENISAVVKEYKETRGLLPIRLCIMGPPAVGKSLVSSQLAKYYKLHHLTIAEVIKEAVEKLERTAARADVDDEEEEDDGGAQQAQEFLDALKDDREENNGRYSDQYILEFYKQRLKSKPCQNQGFVLDGFPKTYEQAKQLFEPEEEEEEEEEEGAEAPTFNKMTIPEAVICLDASDDFLKQRVMNLPESVVAGTHNTEEGFLRRLTLYRSQNEDDNTVLNYFDELEIHPEHIDIMKDQSSGMENTTEQIKKMIGNPRNYGPTPEEKAEMERRSREERIKRETQEREDRERNEAEERALRAKREEEWEAQLAQVRKEEQEMLETQSVPLRNYLMRHVMPTLTRGLIEVCKVKPDDAVDYLAEYLFKNNPQID